MEFKTPKNKTLEELRRQAKAEAKKQIDADLEKAKDIPDNHPLLNDEPKKSKPAFKVPSAPIRKEKRVFVMPDWTPKKLRKPKSRVEGEVVRVRVRNQKTDEAKILEKYPHVIPGTLQHDAIHRKQTVEAKMTCGHTRRVNTCDLFQVKLCHECRAKQRTERIATHPSFGKRNKK